MTEATIHRRVLGIEGATSEEDIRRRHRALMKRHHPDRAPRGRESESLERAKQLNAARDWLLSHPSAWRVATPRPTVPRAENIQSRPATYAPPVHTRGRPSAVAPPPPRSGRSLVESVMSWVGVFLVLYLGLLAFAIVGWVVSALLGL